ncbi:MAG: fused MFS/spermidine synthase [Gammaproteobacteria bacterium]
MMQTTSADLLPRTKYSGLALAALAGAAVMVVELGVARVLTPVFGGSIMVWAIVIATTMLALAAGYAVGGYLADRRGGIRVATGAALIGALLCAAVPFMRIPLIEATIDLSTLNGATLMALALIAPTLFFLSQVSPALIRGLSADGVSHVGVTAGGIYALSTLGSLVGTLGAVWLFLYMPITLGFIGMALLVTVPALFLWPLPGGVVAAVLVVVMGLQLNAGAGERISGVNSYKTRCEVIYKGHSPYGELRVVDEGADYRYLLVNGKDQGGIDRHTGKSAYRYTDGMIGLAHMYVRKPRQVLVIGLGAGQIPPVLEAAGMEVEVVEIDPEVVRLAREYFGFQGTAVVADGRRFLQRSDKHWDVIMVDAYLGSSPPWQLFTREAFALYRERLNPGGAVVINFIGSHLEAAQRPALEAVVATARTAFPVVETYPDPKEPDDYPTRNIYIVATTGARLEPRQAGDPVSAPSLLAALSRMEPITVRDGYLLTDEAAPLEPLVRRTAEHLRHQSRDFLPMNVQYF